MWVCRHNIYIEIYHVKTPTDVMPTSHLNVIDAMTELCDNTSVNVMLHVFFGIFFPLVCFLSSVSFQTAECTLANLYRKTLKSPSQWPCMTIAPK